MRGLDTGGAPSDPWGSPAELSPLLDEGLLSAILTTPGEEEKNSLGTCAVLSLPPPVYLLLLQVLLPCPSFQSWVAQELACSRDQGDQGRILTILCETSADPKSPFYPNFPKV